MNQAQKICWVLSSLFLILTIAGFLLVFFGQLPPEDTHVGYGLMVFAFITVPFAALPLFVTAAIGNILTRIASEKNSKFFLACVAFAWVNMGLLGLFLTFDGLYTSLNLNPR